MTAKERIRQAAEGIGTQSGSGVEPTPARSYSGTAKDRIRELSIRTGQLQRQDNDLNTWLGDVGSFSSRMSSDYNRRKTTYQSQDTFRAYQEKTGTEISDLLKRAQAAKSYYTQYGKIYDETRGEGVTAKLLEGIDQNINYLEGVQKDLQSEGEWWGQFLDQSDFDAYQQTRKGMEASKGEKWTFTPMTRSALEDNRPLSEKILSQIQTVNQQIEAKKGEVKSEARRVAQEQEEQKRAAGGYAAALGGTKKATDTNPIGSTYAAAYDSYQTPSQKAMAQKGAELRRLKDQQAALSKAYYETENEEQRERILKDEPMWGKYQGIQGLQDTLRVATAVAADAQNPGSGGEPYQIILAKERLAREYGITDEAIRNYALYGDDDSIPADGKYTNISQFIHQLEREQQALSDEMGDAGYDYNRMSKYQRRRIDHAEALVKADERRRAAREDPTMAALGTVIARPFQFVDYGLAALSGIGSSDPSDPKTYVPINTDTMDLTNAVNTVRGEQAKMAEEKWGKPGSFAYQTGMSMADFLFTSGITGNFSGGGKAASNLALGIMGSSAAADTTVSALNRGLSNRQALTLGAIAGAAEIITEKVSLEKLLDMTSLSKSRVGYVLQNIIAEGSEEAASDVINWVADVLVSRDRSEWRLAIAAYEAQGMDANRAFLHALKDQALSIGLDALGGAMSGGIMAGGSVAIDAHYDRATGRDFRQSMKSMDGVYQAVIDTGLESDADSNAYRLAQRYQKVLDKKGSLSDGQLGRLYRANTAAIEAEESAGKTVGTPDVQNQAEGTENAMEEGDTPANRVALLKKNIKSWTESGFGESGEHALADVYDEKMAAQIDPVTAHDVFSRVYTAAMTGQEVTGVEDAPRSLVEAAKIAAKYDLQAAMETPATAETQTAPTEGTVNRSPGFDYNDGRTKRFVSALPTGVAERMDAVARAFGLTIRAVDSVFGGKANAQIVGNEILIDEHVADGVSYILGHEFTHRIQELAGTEYSAFQAALDQGKLQDTAAKIASIYQAKGVEITEAQALDEATADMAGEMLQDGALLDDFLDRNRGNKTLLQKVRDIFRAIIDKLTGAEKRRAQSAEGKLTAALEAAAQNAQAVEGAQTEMDAGAKYQIKTMPDGKQYVQADRQVIFGNDPESWSRQLEDYINGKIRRGEDVQLVAADGDILTLTADTAGKVSSQFRGDGTQLSDAEFERKVSAGAHIDELAEVSRSQGKVKRDVGARHGEFASQGWDYRDAYFQDFDGKYYQVNLSAAIGKDGKIVYNIGAMQERSLPTVTGSSAKGGAQNGEKASLKPNVPQDGGGVKPNYSLKGTEHAERMGRLTQAELNAVQSIGRKSVNDLTGEEIKTLEPFARRYYQEMGEKSPFFRAWFGDWRVNDPTPVQIATQKGDARGVTLNEDTGWNVQVSGKVFGETKAHQNPVNRAAQPFLPFINDIVKKAVLLDSHTIGQTKSPNSVMMHDLYAVADIGHGPEVLKLYVEEMNDPNHADTAKRAYQLQNIEISSLTGENTEGSGKALASFKTADVKSVADLFAAVKGRDGRFQPRTSSKVVDGDGKPLVVYHGTGADFFAFDQKRRGQNFLGQGADGFFFTTARKTAENYAKFAGGDRVIEAYLSMRFPYEIAAPKEIDPIQYWDRDAEIMHEVWRRQDDAIWGLSDGCDGVIIHGEKSDLYVVFDPTQIKSATDNIGTFDKENPDIRFSLKGTEHAERMVELERENAALQAKYEQARKQTRRSDAGKVSEAQVGRYAKMLMDHVGVKGDAKALGLKLQTMYDAVASGKDVDGAEFTYKDFHQMANDIAGDLVSRAVLQDNTMYEDYAALRAYIRETRIVVDAETRENITDYADFRKRNMGRLRLAHGETGNIDQVYNELSREYPGLFDPELSYGQDQLERIAEVMEMVYARKEFNPWAGDMARATQTFANEIMEQFWDLPGQEPTFADRQWRQREALKRRHMAEIQDAVRAEREKGKVQEQKLKKWYADKAAEQRAYKAESEARNRLLKLAARMKRMPVDNTNKTVIRELVGDLDTEARHLTGKKLTELTELRRYVEGKADPNSDIYDPDFILDQRMANNLRRLEMKHIDDMTLQDVKDLTQVLLNLENEIRTSKRLVGQEEARDIYQLGEQTVKDLRAVEGKKKRGVAAALDKHIVTETLSPIRQVRRMVGYKADSPLLKLSEGLADGQRKMMDYQMRAEKPFERFAQDKNFTKGFSGQDAKTVKITGWVRGKLQEVEITPAMRVSLWLHSQNDQNLLHMRDGGVRVPDLELYRKGKLADAYAAGTVVKLSPDMAKNLWGQMTQTERAFARETQKYFREVSQPAINEVSRKLKGYDIAEVENYYPIRTDKTFGKAELETLKFDGTIEGMGFLKERQNFAHNPMYLEDVNMVVEQAIRMHGKYVGLAIPVRNFGKVWNVSTAVQTENGEWVSYGDSVQNAVQAVWGKTGYDYITKLMTDLQGGGKQASNWTKTLNKVRSNYAGAVLTLNASVAMKQAASYPTAAAVLGWGPLVKAMGDIGHVDLDLIAKYTPLQWYRSQGFSTKELGDIQNYGGVMKEVLGKKGLNWIQGIDLATTRKLWKASEFYVRDNSPSLKIGSEEYYQAVADIYNRVIEETQPNYTTMQRPQLLRSDDTLMGNLAMFKTQPFQNFNILYDAAGEYRAVMERAKAGDADHAEVKAARKNLSRAVTSQVGQLAVFAAMTMAWGMFRGRKDKYEDDEGNVTLWSALGGLGKDMLSGTASMVPFGTEVYEFGSSKLFGERYYGMEPVTIEAIGNAVTALSKLGDTIWSAAKSVLKGEDLDWKGMLYQLDDSADDISKVAGVPYENVTNLFNGVARWALIGAKGKYLGEYVALHLTVDGEKNSKPYMDLLYEAMENDREAYDTMWSQMVKDGFDQKKIKDAMENRMKKAQGVTKASEMEERYVAPDDREVYERAIEQLTGSTLGKRATEQQLKDAKADAYKFATRAGGEKDRERWDRWEAAGMDAGMYALYQLAEEMADKPNDNGNLGTITNEEREAAIRSMRLSRKDSAALWVLAGGNEKSNPWR